MTFRQLFSARIASAAVAVSLAAPAFAAGEPRTHVVGIGACPPWKGMPAEVCADAVASMTTALAAQYDVPDTNVHTLVNEAATAPGVAGFFKGIKIGAQDRVVLYVVLHNGSSVTGQAAAPDEDVMVFWSAKDPKVIEFAIAENKWMRASDFADLVHGLGMAGLIAVFDACESNALATEVFHLTKQGDTKVATIASAYPGQVANLSRDLSRPLFSGILVDALAKSGPLSDAVDQALAETTKDAKPICAARHPYMVKNLGHAVNCDQVPVSYDPGGLLAN